MEFYNKDFGIFKYLYKNYPNEYFDLFSFEVCSNFFPTVPKDGIDIWNQTKLLESSFYQDPWYIIRIKNFKIFANSFTLSTHYIGELDYPKHIIVEGSFLQGPWVTLQNKSIGDDMNGHDRKVYYSLSEGLYDSFRLTMIGLDTRGENLFVIKNLDFYGKLIPKFAILKINTCIPSYFQSFFNFISFLSPFVLLC